MNNPTSSSQKLQFTIVEAFDLPKSLFKNPKYYASVRVGSERASCTKTVKGVNPKWDEAFSFDVQESATITVEMFQVTAKGPLIMAGLTLSVAECLQAEFQTIQHTYDRHSPETSSMPKRARLVLSWAVVSDGSIPAIVVNNPPIPIASTADATTHNAEDLNLANLETLVEKEANPPIDTAESVTTSSDNFSVVMSYLERFVQIGDTIAEVHPYAKLAWTVVTAAQKVLKAQQDRDDQVRKMWGTVVDALDFMKQSEPLKEIQGLEKTTQAMMKQIYDCTLFLRSYGNRNFTFRTLRDTFTVKTDTALDEFSNAFIQLRDRFHGCMNIDSWKIARTMKEGVIQLVTNTDRLKEIAEDGQLGNLPGANLSAVQWDPDRTCIAGTRKVLLDGIMEWVHDLESERILWLSGAAGTGKSSVANSVAQQLYSLGRLGASFRFDRDVVTPETPSQLFGNLCLQIARFDNQLRTAVLSAIHNGCGGAMSLRMQARTLLVETTKGAEIVGPVVIVIDALDESGTDHSQTEPSRETLVRAIIEELPAFPPSIKVFITSRDEGIISWLMPRCSSCVCKKIEDVSHTEEDILHYIQHRMGQIRKALPNPSNDWPGAAKEAELAHAADGLFIWASVACAFLQSGGDDPNIQLDELLGTPEERVTAESKLDRLFGDVLQRSLPEAKGIRANNWHYVVGSLVALKTPLTYQHVDTLLGLSAKPQQRAVTLFNGHPIKLTTSFYIISSLRPILRIDADLKDPIRLLHKSVFDFLINWADSSVRVDLAAQNGILAMQCLLQMNCNLRYDICGIGDRSLLNSEVEGLSQCIRECIPTPLGYACHYFTSHLNDMATPHPTLLEELYRFITQKLIYWIETMSLLNHLYEAESCLQVLSHYLKKVAATPDTIEIIGNAITLLRNFGHAISLSSLHTYASGIALAPKTSMLYQTYFHLIPELRTVVSSHPIWSTSLRTLEGHRMSVYSVAFSPDGKKLASGSWDSTVRLWDVETGTAIGSALDGHSNGVYSITLSPDGKKLASGSWDSTVRLWDVETGTAIGSALEGHSRGVNSITFSPDGKRLASGSSDSTVRLWDVETGTAVGSALDGYSSGVCSITLSPDGKKLASGSSDSIVRLWDVETGTAIGSALEGHSDVIHSITFSPDGKKLASGSRDATVRLWHVETGTAIGSALEGHSDVIQSITFSPDGSMLASGSEDSTLRLWDVETGTAIGSALEGHSDIIRSITFSPDGKKLASGSWDSTVRLWDVETGTAIGSALGHSDVIHSVTFSPDGRMLASGSFDSTVRLWDVETGTAIGSALDGHSCAVYSITFSPDGKKLASGSRDSTVRLWDVETGSLLEIRMDCHVDSVFHKDSYQQNYLISQNITNHHTIIIDDQGFLSNYKGHRLLWLPVPQRGRIAVSPDGIIIVGGGGRAVTFIK